MPKKTAAPNYSQTYIKFINLVQAIRELPTFPSLDGIEQQLLNAFVVIWNQKESVRVVEAMQMFPDISSSTVHRRLVTLRKKGLISLESDEENQRIKYIVPTPLAYKYFAMLGECLNKAIAT
ncbi:hypothetical protein GALL_75760 [mine drainage metagenome]|uniref:MarR family transcriptional regulator n=1 Tax=mine drainage metagenome TaxID=410659 RepID=A0A1J5T3H8_9ZZZZ